MIAASSVTPSWEAVRRRPSFHRRQLHEQPEPANECRSVAYAGGSSWHRQIDSCRTSTRSSAASSRAGARGQGHATSGRTPTRVPSLPRTSRRAAVTTSTTVLRRALQPERGRPQPRHPQPLGRVKGHRLASGPPRRPSGRHGRMEAASRLHGLGVRSLTDDHRAVLEGIASGDGRRHRDQEASRARRRRRRARRIRGEVQIPPPADSHVASVPSTSGTEALVGVSAERVAARG
jgi:hypothetical protein